MRQAIDECPSFAIGQGDSATVAVFAPLDFPQIGDERLAAALSTTGPISGDLLSHMVKVRQGHVIVGIVHANLADAVPPDAALTRSLIGVALANLEGLPIPEDDRN
jgi:hypothetical protein